MTSVSDDFNRANEALEANANWTAPGAGSMSIVSNVLQTDSSSVSNKTVYDSLVFANDQQAECEILNLPEYTGPACRCSNSGSPDQGYSAECRPGGGIEIYRNGAVLVANLSSAGVSANSGDRVAIRAIGTSITARLNDVEVGGGTDASVSSGYPGLVAYCGSGQNVFDNFEATDEFGSGGFSPGMAHMATTVAGVIR